MLDKINLGKKDFFASWVTVGKAWWVECRVIVHIVSTVRKHRETKVGAQLAVSVFACLPFRNSGP